MDKMDILYTVSLLFVMIALIVIIFRMDSRYNKRKMIVVLDKRQRHPYRYMYHSQHRGRNMLKNYRRERFEDISIDINKQVLTTSLTNMKPILEERSQEVDIDFMETMVGVLEKGTNIPNNWQGTTLCIDDIYLNRVMSGNKGTHTKIKKEGYFVRLLHRDNKDKMNLPYDIVNKKIGVFDICEKHLVQSIAYGYRVQNIEPIINVNFIPKRMWNNLEKLLLDEYDIIFAYIIQGSEFEKLIYSQEVYITGFDKLDISRVKITYPYITMRDSYMEDVYDWKAIKVPKALYKKEGIINLLWFSHNLFIIGEPKNAPVTSPNMETFITRLTVSKEMSDPAYRCYGDITNENRALCNSSYDQLGRPKEYQTYWDIPCTENEECPFYKANKNYPNSFGGCTQNGTCEFPVGINRQAYIKYKDEFPFTPFCYGCDENIEDCCKDQKENPEKYPQLSSPDYVFPNDITQRGPRGLQTTLKLV